MIDYCKTKISVAGRTIHFVDMILEHNNVSITEFETFEDFEKFLKKNNIRSCAGFNKNKKGYMETLRFIYNLK